jgi:hypothetical protein
MYFFGFLSIPKLIGGCGVVGWLRSNAPEGNTGISILSLEYPFVFFFLHSISGGQYAIPILSIPESDMRIA